MARELPEWIGTSDDQRAPGRVRDRLRDKYPTCYLCDQPFDSKKVALDHVKALINGGENRESNLRPVHITCHAEKTAEDVAEKKRIAAIRKKHRGIVDEHPPIQGAPFRASKKTLNREQRAAERQALPPRAIYREPRP